MHLMKEKDSLERPEDLDPDAFEMKYRKLESDIKATGVELTRNNESVLRLLASYHGGMLRP